MRELFFGEISPRFGGGREMNRARDDNILTGRLLWCIAGSLSVGKGKRLHASLYTAVRRTNPVRLFLTNN